MFSPAFVIVKTWTNTKWLKSDRTFPYNETLCRWKRTNKSESAEYQLQDMLLSEKARCYK